MIKQAEENQLVSEFIELKNAINRSSEYTQRQIESIDSNLLLGSFVSLAFAFGVTFVFELLKYWIPASFLLIWLWALYTILVVIRQRRSRESPEGEELIGKVGGKQTNLAIVSLFKNSAPLIKAVSCIYGITLVVLAMIANETIKVGVAFPLAIPAASAVLLSSAFIFCDTVTNFFERRGLGLSLREMLSIRQRTRVIGQGLLAFTYFLLLLVLPIWSLWVTQDLYWPLSKNILVFLVLIIQLVTLAMLASYFSSISARKELGNTTTTFANIDYQLSHSLLSGELNEAKLANLKKHYFNAKKYEVVIDDTLKFVNFYFLRPNWVYLTNLKEEEKEEQKHEERKKA